MRKFFYFVIIAIYSLNAYSQFVYPDPPKSTNDATIIGGLRYPHLFKFEGNPVSRMHGAADPDVQVYGDTLWVYTSQDRKMIPGVHVKHYDAMDGYHAFSTTDMVNWTNHGEVLHSSDVSWANEGFLWAPGSARKNGKYYLYYPIKDKNSAWKIGVAVGNTPIGPFTDSGKPIDGLSSIDPKVFIDDDGEAYIYNNPGVVAKLNPNMIELAETARNITYGTSDIMTSDATRFQEGSYMHKRDGVYYYSYSNYSSEDAGGFYAMGSSPYGPFEWKGLVAKSPAGSAQDHHSIVEFKGQWYYFYHMVSSTLPQYKEEQGRIFSFDRLYYNKDKTMQQVIYTQGTIKILKTNAPNGSILLSPAGGSYAPGTKVTVTVKSDLGYAFNGWSGDLNGTSTSETIVMDADKSITANYITTPTYTLSATSSQGPIVLNPAGGVYNPGDEVQLTPAKVLGYRFSSWSGDLTGSVVPESITMNSNKSVEANYVSVPTYSLTSIATNGIIEFSPAGPIYEEGTVVTVKAKNDYGYAFKEWTGDLTGTNNTMTFTMNSNKNITASFSDLGGGKIVFANNCGGSDYRSEDGVYYKADSKYNYGFPKSTATAISGTNDDILFQKYRWGTNFGYKVPLPNKTYKVTLMYAEPTHNAANNRVFDVSIEGVKVSSNLDVYAKVGKFKAYTESHIVTIKDGELTIGFTKITDTGIISAIKVEEVINPNSVIENKTNNGDYLSQNKPNPFSTKTSISYNLNAASDVELAVYDLSGRKINVLVNEYQTAGNYSIDWNVNKSKNQLSNGLYIYQLTTNKKPVQFKKAILIR